MSIKEILAIAAGLGVRLGVRLGEVRPELPAPPYPPFGYSLKERKRARAHKERASRLKPRDLDELQINVRKMTNWQNYQWLHSGLDLFDPEIAAQFATKKR